MRPPHARQPLLRPVVVSNSTGRPINEPPTRPPLQPYSRGCQHHTVGVMDGIRPKPHPDMLLACLARLEVTAPETVFVGDSPSARDAARAAGVHFIALGEQDLETPRVSMLRELPAFLASRPKMDG